MREFRLDTIGPAGDCAVLQVTGEVDVYTAPMLRERIREVAAKGAGSRSDVGGDEALGLDAERGVDPQGGSRTAVRRSRFPLVGSWLASPWPGRLRASFRSGHSHAIRGAAEIDEDLPEISAGWIVSGAANPAVFRNDEGRNVCAYGTGDIAAR